MKPNFSNYSDPDLNEVATKLSRILTNLNLDNLNHRFITGTTDPVANTQRLFKHGMTPRPSIAWTVEGNAYVKQISNTDVDVRSNQASQNFKLIALG